MRRLKKRRGPYKLRRLTKRRSLRAIGAPLPIIPMPGIPGRWIGRSTARGRTLLALYRFAALRFIEGSRSRLPYALPSHPLWHSR
jgi:hypothetical protein